MQFAHLIACISHCMAQNKPLNVSVWRAFIPSSCHPRCVFDCLLVASSFVEGNNRWAFAQRGVLPYGDIQSSHIDIMSMTFAVVIWNADDPFFNEHCMYSVTSEDDSTFVLLILRFQLGILKMTEMHNDATWTFLPLFLASSITSFLFLTSVSCHGVFSIFCPCLLLLEFLTLEASEWICEQDCNEP